MNALTNQPGGFNAPPPQMYGYYAPQQMPNLQPTYLANQGRPYMGGYYQQPLQHTPLDQSGSGTENFNFTKPESVAEGFYGRYIDDISEVRLDEVPMTGRPCLFPTKDANAVYLKVWNQDGKLLTVKYILDSAQSPSQDQVSDPMKEVNERLRRLEEAIALKEGSANESN